MRGHAVNVIFEMQRQQDSFKSEENFVGQQVRS